jgi:hypothetical protein
MVPRTNAEQIDEELKMDFLIVKCDQEQVRTKKGDKKHDLF